MFGRTPPYARERRVFKGRGGSRWPSLAFLFLSQPCVGHNPARKLRWNPSHQRHKVGCWRQLVDLIT